MIQGFQIVNEEAKEKAVQQELFYEKPLSVSFPFIINDDFDDVLLEEFEVICLGQSLNQLNLKVATHLF